MRIPKRLSQTLRTSYDDETVFLTPEGLTRLKCERDRLDKIERPQAVRDVAEARQKGDLSENAEYQEARARLSRLQSRIFNINEKLKRATIIEKKNSSRIGLGSTVTLRHEGKSKKYQIVGPHEADVLRGRISHLSPLGAALMNKKIGEMARLHTANGYKSYVIAEVR